MLFSSKGLVAAGFMTVHASLSRCYLFSCFIQFQSSFHSACWNSEKKKKQCISTDLGCHRSSRKIFCRHRHRRRSWEICHTAMCRGLRKSHIGLGHAGWIVETSWADLYLHEGIYFFLLKFRRILPKWPANVGEISEVAERLWFWWIRQDEMIPVWKFR